MERKGACQSSATTLLVCACILLIGSGVNAQHVSVAGGSSPADILGPTLEAVLAAGAASVKQSSRQVVITVGDSITALGGKPGGWVARIADAYNSTSDVLNKGVGMGTAKSGAIVTEAITKKFFPGPAAKRVQLVTFCFGANDASIRAKDPAWRFVPVAEYTSLLQRSIDALQAAGITAILLITPPPAAAPPRIDRSLAATAEYAAAVKALGAREGIPVADLFAAIQKVPNWQTQAMLPDGLHLTEMGNAVLYHLVMETIHRQLPHVAPKVPADDKVTKAVTQTWAPFKRTLLPLKRISSWGS